MLHDKKIIKIRSNENTYYIGGVQVTSPSPFWMTLHDKEFGLFAMQISSYMAKISLYFESPMGVVAHHLYRFKDENIDS